MNDSCRYEISVAVALYKGGQFAPAQIQSLLMQTRVPDEIILTDDSPDDSTFHAIEHFLSDCRIRYYRNESTLGVTGNFDRALSLCTGDFIFLCDQDDVWLPNKIETMVQALQDAPECDGAFCNSRAVNAELEPLDFTFWQMRCFIPKMQRQIYDHSLAVMLKRIPVAAHGIVLRRQALAYILPMPDLPGFYPDSWIALQVAIHCNWKLVDDILTLYRVHQNNVTDPQIADLSTQLILSRQARARNGIVQTLHLADELIRRSPQDLDERRMRQLKAFRMHYLRRSSYPVQRWKKWIYVIKEALSLRYFYYSNGWKSIAADLFL